MTLPCLWTTVPLYDCAYVPVCLHVGSCATVACVRLVLWRQVWRDSLEYYQNFSRGVPLMAMREAQLPTEHADRRGTQVGCGLLHTAPSRFAGAGSNSACAMVL